MIQSKFYIKKILFVVFLCCQNAMAAGWSNPTKVLDVYAHSNGHLHVQFEEQINPDGCASASHYRVLNGTLLQDFMFSILLTAQTSDNTVRYYVSGCNHYPNITAVRTLK